MAARPCAFHTRKAYSRYVLKIQLVYNRLTLPFKVNVKITTASKIKRTAKLFPIVPAGHKPGLDKTFLRQLLAILKIAFPSFRSKESLILLLHSFFLVARTVLSVGVARLDGRIVRDLVSADGKGFMIESNTMTPPPGCVLMRERATTPSLINMGYFLLRPISWASAAADWAFTTAWVASFRFSAIVVSF